MRVTHFLRTGAPQPPSTSKQLLPCTERTQNTPNLGSSSGGAHSRPASSISSTCCPTHVRDRLTRLDLSRGHGCRRSHRTLTAPRCCGRVNRPQKESRLLQDRAWTSRLCRPDWDAGRTPLAPSNMLALCPLTRRVRACPRARRTDVRRPPDRAFSALRSSCAAEGPLAAEGTPPLTGAWPRLCARLKYVPRRGVAGRRLAVGASRRRQSRPRLLLRRAAGGA